MNTWNKDGNYQYGLDKEIVSPLSMQDIAFSEAIASHAESRNATGGIVDRRAKATVHCNQMRWDGEVCDWQKNISERMSRIVRASKVVLYHHLKDEHASMGKEWLRVRMNAITPTMKDFSRL